MATKIDYGTPVVATKAEPTTDPKQLALIKLETVRASALEHKGAKGCNPFMFIKEVLDPLVKRVQAGEASAIDLVMKMDPTVKPSIDKSWLDFSSVDYEGLVLKPVPESLKVVK